MDRDKVESGKVPTQHQVAGKSMDFNAFRT
jgi:hypothetical protein